MPFWNKNNERNEEQDPSLQEMNERFVRHTHSFDVTPRPGFKEALMARILELRRTHSMQRISARTWAFAVPALVILVVAALVFQPFFGVKPVYAYDNFLLTPEASDALGVEPTSSFILESREPVSVGDIRDDFSVNVDTPYTLDQISNKEIRVTFEEPLDEEMVAFSLETIAAVGEDETMNRPYGWAFPVKVPLAVDYTLPGDETTGTPLDSGIEVRFNYENISVEDFENAFSISPEVDGHVEQYRETFVFVPEALQPETLYTVTIDGGLGALGSDDTIGEDYVFQFETSASDWRGYEFRLNEHYHTVTPTTDVRMPFYEWGNEYLVPEPEVRTGDEVPTLSPGASVAVQATVYRFDSVAEFAEAMERAMDLDWQSFVTAEDIADVDDLSVASQFEAQRIEIDYQNFLLFPARLEKGYYLADISVAGKRTWALMQSSNLTAYIARATDRTMVWVNSAETHEAVSGARIGYVGEETRSSTDSSGIGFVPSNAGQGHLVEVTEGSETIILPLMPSYWIASDWSDTRPASFSTDQYWSYLYTDRPMYKPTDTMKVWGYVEDRTTGARPSEVRLVTRFDETVVEVADDGTFTGEIAIDDVSPTTYEVSVQIGEETVARRNITVMEYVKPAYTLSLTPDVNAAFVGETIGYTVHGEFFEGTPMKGLAVNVETDVGVQSLTLDEAGNARGSFVMPYNRTDNEWRYHQYPTSAWMRAYPVRSEEGYIEANASVQIFGSRVYLTVPSDESTIENGTGSVRIIASNVQATNSYNVEEFTTTPRAGQVVDGRLVEVTYIAHEEGTTYDFIRKQTVKQYRYERVEKIVNEFSLTTGADGSVVYTFAASNPEANYEVRVRATDEFGRSDTTSTFVWQNREYSLNRNMALEFHNDDAPEQDPWTFEGYGEGETVHLSVHREGEPFVMPEGARILYFQNQRGIQETTIGTTPTYTFPFEGRDIPNVFVRGVLFHENGYSEIGGSGFSWGMPYGGFIVTYNTSLSELTVELTPDQESYEPGEEATVVVRVTDREGNPVDANVNVNVVDEAFYALAPEQVDPLAMLYQWLEEGIEATKVSTTLEADLRAGAEGGGGGERGRFDFKDSAHFIAVRTGSDGEVETTFTLPDDITSWRVTGQALETDNKMAGHAKIGLDSTLPFFISPVLRESYLTDDQPTMLIRSAGTEVSGPEPVEYTVSVRETDFSEVIQTTVGATARYTLPDLAEGTYEITIDAKSGDLSDRMTRTVRLVPSRLMQPVISRVMLNQTNAIQGASEGYTEITFVDGNKGRYYNELQELAYSFGDRADEAAVRVMATELMNETFGESRQVPSMDPATYQGNGVRLLPYGDEDFVLTAKLAMLQDTPFNEDSLVYYFENRFTQERYAERLNTIQAAQAYAALAALGEPVIGEVQRFATRSDIGVDEKLYLALALHFSGDDERARQMFRDLMKETKTELGYTFLDADDEETRAERTALLAALGTGLNEPGSESMHEYVETVPHGDTLLVLEQLLFIKEALPHLESGEVTIAYTLEGERRTETLENGSTFTLMVSPDELAALNAEVRNGRALAISSYQTSVIDPNADVDPALSVSRSYSVNGQTTNTFKEGDVVRVSIPYTVPPLGCGNGSCESYQLVDVLPSGLAPVTPTSGISWMYQSPYGEQTCVDYPTQVWNQRVTFYVTAERSYADCEANTVQYYARVVTPGSYEAEPVYLRHATDLATQNYSAPSTVVITE